MNLPRWSLRYPVTASMVLVCVVVLGGLAVPRLPLAFLPEVDFPVARDLDPLPQRAADAGRGGDHAPRRGGARHHEPRAAHHVALVDRRRDHLGRVRLGRGHRPAARRGAREARPHPRPAAGRRRPDPGQRLPLERHPGPRVPRLGRARPVARLRAAQPPRRRSAAARARRGQGRALRRRPATGARSTSASTRSSATDCDADARAGAPRRLEPQHVRGPAEARRGELAAARRQPVRARSTRSARCPVNDRGLRLRDVAADRPTASPTSTTGATSTARAPSGSTCIKESGANSVDVAAPRAPGARRHRPATRRSRASTCSRSPTRARRSRNSLRGLLEAGVDRRPARDVSCCCSSCATCRRRWSSPPPSRSRCSARRGHALLHASHAEHPVDDGPHARGGHAGRQRGGGAREHPSTSPERARARSTPRSRARRRCRPRSCARPLTSVIVFLPLVLGGRTEITTWLGEVGRTIIFTLVCSLLPVADRDPARDGPRAAARCRASRRRRGSTALAVRYERVLDWTLAHRAAPPSASRSGSSRAAIVAFIPVDKSTFTGNKVEAVRIDYEFADNLNQREAENYVTRVEDWILPRKDCAPREVDLLVLHAQPGHDPRLPRRRVLRRPRRRVRAQAAAQGPARAAGRAAQGARAPTTTTAPRAST